MSSGGGLMLFAACNNGRADLVQALLLDDQCDVANSVGPPPECTPVLYTACNQGHAEVVALLLVIRENQGRNGGEAH